MITAQGVADTLRLLLPGFVALKVFYFFGLRSKRSDAQWTLLSVLAAVPLTGLAGVLRQPDDGVRTTIALLLAVIAGVVAGGLWKVAVAKIPTLGPDTSIRAWDAVLSQPSWLQIWTKDQRIFRGTPRFVASSVETDDLDIYIEDVAVITAEGAAMELPGVTGVLLNRSEISYIAVFPPGDSSADRPPAK